MNRRIRRLLKNRETIKAQIMIIDVALDLIVNGTAEAGPLELAILDRGCELVGIKGGNGRGR